MEHNKPPASPPPPLSASDEQPMMRPGFPRRLAAIRRRRKGRLTPAAAPAEIHAALQDIANQEKCSVADLLTKMLFVKGDIYIRNLIVYFINSYYDTSALGSSALGANVTVEQGAAPRYAFFNPVNLDPYEESDDSFLMGQDAPGTFGAVMLDEEGAWVHLKEPLHEPWLNDRLKTLAIELREHAKNPALGPVEIEIGGAAYHGETQKINLHEEPDDAAAAEMAEIWIDSTEREMDAVIGRIDDANQYIARMRSDIAAIYAHPEHKK